MNFEFEKLKKWAESEELTFIALGPISSPIPTRLCDRSLRFADAELPLPSLGVAVADRLSLGDAPPFALQCADPKRLLLFLTLTHPRLDDWTAERLRALAMRWRMRLLARCCQRIANGAAPYRINRRLSIADCEADCFGGQLEVLVLGVSGSKDALASAAFDVKAELQNRWDVTATSPMRSARAFPLTAVEWNASLSWPFCAMSASTTLLSLFMFKVPSVPPPNYVLCVELLDHRIPIAARVLILSALVAQQNAFGAAAVSLGDFTVWLTLAFHSECDCLPLPDAMPAMLGRRLPTLPIFDWPSPGDSTKLAAIRCSSEIFDVRFCVIERFPPFELFRRAKRAIDMLEMIVIALPPIETSPTLFRLFNALSLLSTREYWNCVAPTAAISFPKAISFLFADYIESAAELAPRLLLTALERLSNVISPSDSSLLSLILFRVLKTGVLPVIDNRLFASLTLILGRHSDKQSARRIALLFLGGAIAALSALPSLPRARSPFEVRFALRRCFALFLSEESIPSFAEPPNLAKKARSPVSPLQNFVFQFWIKLYYSHFLRAAELRFLVSADGTDFRSARDGLRLSSAPPSLFLRLVQRGSDRLLVETRMAFPLFAPGRVVSHFENNSDFLVELAVRLEPIAMASPAERFLRRKEKAFGWARCLPGGAALSFEPAKHFLDEHILPRFGQTLAEHFFSSPSVARVAFNAALEPLFARKDFCKALFELSSENGWHREHMSDALLAAAVARLLKFQGAPLPAAYLRLLFVQARQPESLLRAFVVAGAPTSPAALFDVSAPFSAALLATALTLRDLRLPLTSPNGRLSLLDALLSAEQRKQLSALNSLIVRNSRLARNTALIAFDAQLRVVARRPKHWFRYIVDKSQYSLEEVRSLFETLLFDI